MLRQIKPYVTTPPLEKHPSCDALSVREARLEERQVLVARKELELQEKEKELSQRERHLAGTHIRMLTMLPAGLSCRCLAQLKANCATGAGPA